MIAAQILTSDNYTKAAARCWCSNIMILLDNLPSNIELDQTETPLHQSCRRLSECTIDNDLPQGILTSDCSTRSAITTLVIALDISCLVTVVIGLPRISLGSSFTCFISVLPRPSPLSSTIPHAAKRACVISCSSLYKRSPCSRQVDLISNYPKSECQIEDVDCSRRRQVVFQS
jgi:hypothetical protein